MLLVDEGKKQFPMIAVFAVALVLGLATGYYYHITHVSNIESHSKKNSRYTSGERREECQKQSILYIQNFFGMISKNIASSCVETQEGKFVCDNSANSSASLLTTYCLWDDEDNVPICLLSEF